MQNKCFVFPFLAISIFALLTPTHAQWTPLQTGSQYNQYDIFALDDQRIFVGGADGLMKSVDGGQTWTILPLQDQNNVPFDISTILALHFFDEHNGLATGFMLSGNVELILRTTDGGVHWSIVHSRTIGFAPKFLTDFSFPTPQTGYSCGNQGVILKTGDGGQNWTFVQPGGSTGAWEGIFFRDPLFGFAVGNGKILRTTDGGSNWTLQSFPDQQFNAVHFPTYLTGYVAGENGILTTQDGGLTWAAPATQPLDAGGLTDVFFEDALTGYVLDIAGKVYKTTNGGQLWEKTTLSDPQTCRRFFFRDNGAAWVVGDEGKVWKSLNSGGHYAPIAGFTGGGFCAQNDYTFTNLSTPAPGYAYQWLLNGVTFSNDFGASVSFPAPGATYEVQLIVSNSVAADTASSIYQTLPAMQFPTGQLTLTQPLVCAGGQGTLRYDSIWPQSYQLYRNGALVISNWFPFGGNPLTSVQSFGNDPVEFVIATTFSDGCISTPFSDTLYVVPVQNVHAITVTIDQNELCPGDSTLIRVSPTQLGNFYRMRDNGNNELGTFPGNGGELVFPIGPVNLSNGTVTLQVFHPDAGCNTSKGYNLFTVKAIKASTYAGYQLLTGQSVTLENHSVNSVAWHWHFGAGATPEESYEQTPTVSYAAEGLHSFWMEATAPGGCVDTIFGYFEIYQPQNWSQEGAFCAEQAPAVPQFFWYRNSRIRDIQSDPMGNFFIAGFLDTLASNISEVGLLRKTDAAGQVLWEKRFIPNFWDDYQAGGSVRCILVETDPETGNIWVAGEVRSETFQVDNLQFTLGANKLRFFLAKLNASGQIQWVNILDNGWGAGPNNMIYAGSDRLYLCQHGSGGIIRYLTAGFPTENWGFAGQYSNAFILIFKEDGKLAYRKNIGVNPVNHVYLHHRPIYTDLLPAFRGAPDFKFTPEGHLLLYGAARQNFTMDSLSITMLPGTTGGMTGFFAVLDTTTKQWTQAFPTFGIPQNSNNTVSWDETMFSPGFGADTLGNIYLYFGQSVYAFEGNPIPTYVGYGNVILPDGSIVPSGKHSFLMKFDANGALIWNNVNGAAEPVGLDILPDGSIACVANFFSMAGLVSQDGTISGYPGQGWRDWMFTLWTPDGNLQYARNFGTPKFDQVYLMRSKGCGRQVLLYSLNSAHGSGVLSEPLVGVYSPYGDCSGTVNGCEGIINASFNIRPGAVALNVYPNPTSGVVDISLTQTALPGTVIRICTLYGQALLEKRAEAGSTQQQIDLGDLPAGMYFVQVWSGGQVLGVSKIIRQ